MKPYTGERCASCTAPTPQGTFVCADCLVEHDTRLGDLPLLAHALEERFLRQQRFSVASLTFAPDSEQEEAPLPFDDAASRVRRELSRLLLHWCRLLDVVDPLGYPSRLGYARVAATTENMTAHLRRHAFLLPRWPLAGEFVQAVRALHGKALRTVDRPPDLVYLGICSWPLEVEQGRVVKECDVDLYADAADERVRCSGCRNEHDVKNRKAVLLRAVDDQLATASTISRGLSALDITVTAERIRQWKHRKRIVTHGSTRPNDADGGEPLYRVGDVIDLVWAERERLRTDLRKASQAKPPRKADQ